MSKIILFIAVAVLSQSSWAGKVPQDLSAGLDEDVTQISVPVLSSNLGRERILEPASENQPDFVFSYSSYLPSDMSRPSLAAGAETFSQASVPQLSVDRLIVFRDLGSTVLSYDFGISFERLQRSGIVSTGVGTVKPVTQLMNLVALKVGLEYRWKGTFQPAVSADLLPTWLNSPESSIEPGGLSTGGVLGLLSVQWAYSPRWIKMTDQSGAGFGVAADYLVGYVAGSNLSGPGLRGFARINY